MPVQPLALDPAGFLSDHWQRQHLFLPGGLGDFEPPVSADELAGLAMESGVDARIVRHRNGRFSAERGPFTRTALQEDGCWTLLVQRVDEYWPQAAQLFDAVPFLPRWRLDDILMSYATDGGSAGPHYDNYDVFIVQGAGSRQWDIGQPCDAGTALTASEDLRLLADFQPQRSYRLETGDVLYIPPGLAHRGTSIGESTSFSIGARAPRLADLLARWVDDQLEVLADDQLFADPGRSPARRRGEITARDLARAREQLLEQLTTDDGRWFGETVTGQRAAGTGSATTADLDRGAVTLLLAPECRLAWLRDAAGLQLYSAGESTRCGAALLEAVETLCAGSALEFDPHGNQASELRPLLNWLAELGNLDLYDE